MTTSPGLFGSARFLLPMLMVLGPVGAHASGQLPPTEIEDWELPDSGACIAQLTQIHRELLAKANPSPVPRGPATLQTLVFTKGPVTQDADHAVYDVELGYQTRMPLPDMKQIRVQYSYDRRHYVCDGGHLTGTSTQGYTLESYEDMPDAKGPAADGGTGAR